MLAIFFSLLLYSLRLRLCYAPKIELLTLLPYHSSEDSSEDSLYNPSLSSGDNVYPAMLLARDQINKNAKVLQNYTLELIQGISGCQNTPLTLSGFVQEIYQNRSRSIVGIIGPECSSSTIGLAPLSNRRELNLVMLHGSGTAILADRDRFTYQIGLLGSSEKIARAIEFLLQEWSTVIVFYDELRDYYSQIAERLVNTSSNATKIQLISWPSEMHPFREVRRQGLRVVVVLCPPELTRRLLCLSWNFSMVYDNYQFVYTAHEEHVLVQPITFKQDGVEISCSEKVMRKALRGHFLVVYSLITPRKDTLSLLNVTVSEYESLYESYREDYNNKRKFLGRKSEYSQWATYLYDSIWTWALVLDNLTKTQENIFEGQDNIYGDRDVANIILEQFYETTFQGISGEIRINRSSGFMPREVEIMQVERTGSRTVAIADSTTVRTIAAYNQIDAVLYVRENLIVSWIFIIVAIGFLVLTASLQILTLKHHKDGAVKATTPMLLHMSYVGIYFSLLGLIVYLMYSALPLSVDKKGCVCTILWIWMLPIGFTLSFGPIAMRTWRLYRIFIHFRNPGLLISNNVLIGGVLSLLMVDISVAILWTTINRLETDMKVVPSTSPHFQVYCKSQWWWFMIILVTKALLLFYIVVLTFLTRKIKKTFFSTHSLQLLNYFVFLTLVLGISLHFVLLNTAININWSFACLCITVLSFTFFFLLCAFLPPLLPTLRKKLPFNKSSDIK